MRDNLYIFGFATVVCIGCSLMVALAAKGLEPYQIQNAIIDTHRNILMSVGIPEDPTQHLPAAEVERLFKERFKPLVVDNKGKILEGIDGSKIDIVKTEDQFPLYQYIHDNRIEAYVIPVAGKGLWSTIYGYIALEPDLNTVKGITFYKHGETPGLGGEVEKPWFLNNFKGKRIRNDSGELVSIRVVKGHVKDVVQESEYAHAVDGISGATITGNGITHFLKKCLVHYEPYFNQLQNAPKEGNS